MRCVCHRGGGSRGAAPHAGICPSSSMGASCLRRGSPSSLLKRWGYLLKCSLVAHAAKSGAAPWKGDRDEHPVPRT